MIEAVAKTGLRGLHSAHSFKVEMPDLCCWLGVLFGTSLDESVLVVSNRVRHESCMNMMSLTGAPT